jgi:hypothetical protein
MGRRSVARGRLANDRHGPTIQRMNPVTATRRLLVTRRPVGLPATEAYLRTWAAVRRAVEDGGGRAWVFRHAEDEGSWLEFVEWQGEADLPERLEVHQARHDLEGFGMGETELWREPRESVA